MGTLKVQNFVQSIKNGTLNVHNYVHSMKDCVYCLKNDFFNCTE